jgi:hypothetical protein
MDSWCKSLSYNGIIRARSNSTPARPYMARLRVFSLLICPSVCPLLQGSDTAFRTASISQASNPSDRSIAKQASEPHRQAPYRCELGGRGFQRIDVGDLPGGHLAAGFDAKRRRG